MADTLPDVKEQRLREVIAANIRRHRERLGWTQRDLAVKLELNPESGRAYVVNMEAGRVGVSIARVAHLSRIFRITPAELLSE